MAEKIRAVPGWAWLALIVLVSFVARAWLARSMVAPFIMVDELIYSELARAIAADGHFAVRDVPTRGYGILYPLLISPAYLLFTSLPDAYAAVKTINALVMSLAAVPAYLLARRMLPQGLSLVCALLAVSLPSLVYTGSVMTENLFYPLLLATVLALVLVLERPTAGRQLLLLGFLLASFATRVQAVALVPAIVVAPLLLAWFERRGLRDAIRPYRWTIGLVVGGVAAVVLTKVARGQSISELFGAYSTVGNASYDVGSVLRYTLWHAEELTLYLGIIPVAAAIVLVALARRQPRAIQAFLAAAIPVVVFFTLEVGAFASHFIPRIQERNLFPVAPLVLIAFVVWVYRGAPRPLRIAIPAITVACGLVLVFPYTRFIETGAISDTLALLPIWTLYGSLLFSSIVGTVLVGALVAAALFLGVPSRYAIVLPFATLLWFAVIFKPIWSGERGFVQASRGALYQGIRDAPRDWIDRAVPAGNAVAIVWTARPDRFTVNQNEFFNRRVGPIYYTSYPTPGGLAETKLDLDPVTGKVTYPDGTPFRAPYVLVDSTIDPAGVIVARDPGLGLTLWRLDRPLESVSRVTGLYPNDTWSGKTVTYTRRQCDGGAVAVGVSSDPSLTPDPPVVTAHVNGRLAGRMRPDANGSRSVFRVSLEPRGGVCRVVYTVTPTAIPSEVNGTADDRVLGARFDGFTFEQ
jgi:hypothetical protein